MRSKKKPVKKSLLYLIIDKKTAGHKRLLNISKQARDSGVDIIQFRDKLSNKESVVKDAILLRKLFSGTKTAFIVNDYLDVAKIVDSDGIHLGQSDTSIGIARRILGEYKIIGVSCHNLKQALLAQERGADYIGIGPVFPTPTKPEYKPIGLRLIREFKKKIRIPFFVIGDVNLDNIGEIVSSGARRVAVCRAVLNLKNISSTVKKFAITLRQ